MYQAQHMVMTVMITKNLLPASQCPNTLHILTRGILTSTIGGRCCFYHLIVAMKY